MSAGGLMTKLLTERSRLYVGAILAWAVLFLFGSLLGYEYESTKYWASTAQVIVIIVLLGLAMYFTNIQPTAVELMEAAKDRMHTDRNVELAWATIEIRKAKFREMTKGAKVFYALLIFSGVAFCLIGLADALDLLPSFIRPLQINGANGTVTTVPKFFSGLLYIGFGIMALLVASITRVNMVDRVDEAVKKLFNEFKDLDPGKLPKA